MTKDRLPSVEDVLGAGDRADYKIVRRRDGTIEIEARDDADHRNAMDALERIGQMWKEPAYREAVAANARAPTPRESSKPASNIPDTPIGKAATQWLADIKPHTLGKTLSIKAAAVEGFAKYFGEKKNLADAGRIDVGRWVEALRASVLQTPTISNKCGYLRGFFDWVKARGIYPTFAKDDNPAAGQIIFRTREKRACRVLGFKAFADAQIKILSSHEALECLPEAARWGAWIGLHTGARVAEVGQFALSDFIEVDGVPCISITNESLGQSVKNDASIRVIPVHPTLISLGLLDRVETLRTAGEKRLFPKVKVDGVNGAGNWLSKAFSRHTAKHVKLPEKGKHGFHSLRKSVVQGLQTVGVSSELRAAYVGHELDDEHHAAYSRNPTPKELLTAIRKLDWNVPHGS